MRLVPVSLTHTPVRGAWGGSGTYTINTVRPAKQIPSKRNAQNGMPSVGSETDG